MARATRNNRGIARAACSAILVISFLAGGLAPIFAAEPSNLALNKPACSSSIENDEHSAAKANDGRPTPVGVPTTSPRAGRSGGRSIWKNLSIFPAARFAGPLLGKDIGTKSKARPTAKTGAS